MILERSERKILRAIRVRRAASRKDTWDPDTYFCMTVGGAACLLSSVIVSGLLCSPRLGSDISSSWRRLLENIFKSNFTYKTSSAMSASSWIGSSTIGRMFCSFKSCLRCCAERCLSFFLPSLGVFLRA